MSKLEQLIAELCPDGVEYKKIKEVYKRLRGTPITAEKMKQIDNPDGDIRIIAGGKTVINAFEKDEDTLNEVEVAYFMCEQYQRRGYTKQAVNAITKWCFTVSDIPYLILTIDCANTPSCTLAEKCGFELFEKRTPIGHAQPNMESGSYFYYRLYRK